MQPFQVPADTCEGPFSRNRFKAPEMEGIKSKHGFDNPEYGFHRTFLQGIDCFPCNCLEPAPQPHDRIGIVGEGRRLAESFRERPVMAFPVRGDVRRYVLLFTVRDICFAEVPTVGEKGINRAKVLRKRFHGVEDRFQFFLIIGMLADVAGNNEHGIHVHGSLGIIGLFESASLGHDSRFAISQVHLVFARRAGYGRLRGRPFGLPALPHTVPWPGVRSLLLPR